MMTYNEPPKRVTKNDKKHKKSIYSQKHIRNKLLIIEKGAIKTKENNCIKLFKK
jgi:hypothetical protein